MIGRVVLAGADVDLLDVSASVTIRHGRQGPDDAPLASTATLTIVNVTRELASSFEVADELLVLLEDDSPRFVGRITDAELQENGLAITAVSRLGRVSGRTIGATDWPAEPWSSRVFRAFDEARLLLAWEEVASSWATSPGTWGAPSTTPRLRIEVGDTDPNLAARPASPTTLAAYLQELTADEPAAIASLPDGSTLVQALSYRKAIAAIALDPNLVAFAPTWAMTDEVSNEIALLWDGGELDRADASSIDAFESRPLHLQTELAAVADAAARAGQALARRAFPRWRVGAVELLDLDPAITIGTPVAISSLPAWAPADSYLGLVEGWTDHVEPADDALEWTIALALSDPRISGFGLQWRYAPGSWAAAGAIAWADASDLILV